ncbi:transposase [Marinisporobacter balticus]|uniref:Transposase n=1 Tax=Marinisporobacter balticus TaxID=2018667 RepID=A0A4R2KEV6_9FIRM|nr:transposase [Marinisporobacter balticus]TCO68866.1 transposase [Marinisporobacter balticus]
MLFEAFVMTSDASIIFDKFHVVKRINEEADKVRREEVKENELLKSTRYI